MCSIQLLDTRDESKITHQAHKMCSICTTISHRAEIFLSLMYTECIGLTLVTCTRIQLLHKVDAQITF